VPTSEHTVAGPASPEDNGTWWTYRADMRLTEDDARRRFATAPVARLASVRPDGAPHVVPVVFAVVDDVVFTAVDHKPKRSARLQRLTNLRAEPRCSLLADAYDPDWSRLWWVRADGEAQVVERPPAGHPGITALADRHPVYREHPPVAALVRIDVRRWTGWAADDAPG
jgi:PPOX class probable F420-dependent enzyme